MNICPKCNRKIGDVKYCNYCGAKIDTLKMKCQNTNTLLRHNLNIDSISDPSNINSELDQSESGHENSLIDVLDSCGHEHLPETDILIDNGKSSELENNKVIICQKDNAIDFNENKFEESSPAYKPQEQINISENTSMDSEITLESPDSLRKDSDSVLVIDESSLSQDKILENTDDNLKTVDEIEKSEDGVKEDGSKNEPKEDAPLDLSNLFEKGDEVLVSDESFVSQDEILEDSDSNIKIVDEPEKSEDGSKNEPKEDAPLDLSNLFEKDDEVLVSDEPSVSQEEAINASESFEKKIDKGKERFENDSIQITDFSKSVDVLDIKNDGELNDEHQDAKGNNNNNDVMQSAQPELKKTTISITDIDPMFGTPPTFDIEKIKEAYNKSQSVMKEKNFKAKNKKQKRHK